MTQSPWLGKPGPIGSRVSAPVRNLPMHWLIAPSYLFNALNN
jgi:hypothetical protein